MLVDDGLWERRFHFLLHEGPQACGIMQLNLLLFVALAIFLQGEATMYG